MQARSLVAAAAVLLVLVVGAQLTFSPVGQPVGPWWSDPATAATLSSAEDAEVLEVAAAGGPQGGAVGWIARTGNDYRVTVVPVSVDGGQVTLDERRTVVREAAEIQGLDVAATGDDVALVWERAFTNDVVYHRLGAGESQIVSADPVRVVGPSVALVEGGAVVAWQEFVGSGFLIELAAVTDAGVRYRTVPVPTGGSGSPAVDRAGDGFAIAWFDGRNRTASAAFGEIRSGQPMLSTVRPLGQARPAGGFGGGTGPMSMDAGAHEDVVRGVWLDLATVMTAQVDRAGASTDPVTLQRGDRPAVAVGDGRWVATWIVSGREADTDLAFVAGGDRAASGVLSRFPSSANHPSPFYAPGAAVAWSERGAQSRVLISGLRNAPQQRYRTRLLAEPGRILFIGLAAAVVAVVSLPIMPWVFLSLLAAFYLTNRFIRERVIRALAQWSSWWGASLGEQAVKERLDAAPPIVWAAAFAVVEVGLLVYLLPAVGASTPLTFAGPIAISVGAALGTGLLQLVAPQRSAWRIMATFAYLQTAGLWATALPDVL